MIKFYLYAKFENRKLIAEVADENLAHELIAYCNRIYDNDKFLVTIKRPYKKELKICGNYKEEK